MTTNTPILRLVTAAAAVLTAVAFLSAGPLNPPAGPVAATAKGLADLEPRTAVSDANTPGDATSLFRITQPGSYYLTGNITGVAGKHGFRISASGVTLDLNGFTIAGPGAGNFDGISAPASASLVGLTVRNGTVRGWGGRGIGYNTGFTFGARISGINVTANGGIGMDIGSGSCITGCTADGNSGGGIFGDACTVRGCTATRNGVDGIRVRNGSVVSGCSADANTGNGLRVISACLISDCTVSTSGADGINILGPSLIHDNAVSSTVGAAIHSVDADACIEGNTCVLSGRGIQLGGHGNLVRRNTCASADIPWDFAANNAFAYSINPALNAPSISGFSSSGSALWSDPNINVTR